MFALATRSIHALKILGQARDRVLFATLSLVELYALHLALHIVEHTQRPVKMFWLSVLVFSILHYACATPTSHRILSKRGDGVFSLRNAEAIKSRGDLNFTSSTFLLKEIGGIARSTSG